MAKIPLRAYTKEIETLIERGEIEQAVAHAKNILRSYPKHIDTYRLLGKAYLESQRYSEAADILQRVLSVLPDDFISQIGMSIIREDEGNLDAAIWHMERAYEVQPFNPAVNDELRRLYGRRDGLQPPKIRLTRGALVRQYMRGELYPQAIAETRIALSEDEQRLDLKVLLARLYYLSGQKNDAAEAASDLLQKLPYCFEANHLMAEILPSAGRAEEAKQFHQRIFSLDPYQAFTSPSAQTSDLVPDQAVMVEQYDVNEAMGEAAPQWAQSVGIEWEEPQEAAEDLPDWLNTLKPDRQTSSLTEIAPAPEIDAAQTDADSLAEGEEAGQSDVIPDWMKEAGWSPTDRSADEIMAEQAQNESAGEAEEIVGAEIPDWLQAMAPPAPAEPHEEERTEWLETLLENPAADSGKQEDQTIISSPEVDLPEAAEGDEAWLAGLVAEAGTAAPSEAVSEDLSWLTEAQEGANSETTGQPEAEGLPDWNQFESAAESAGEQPAAADDTPDWLKSFEEPSAEQPTQPAEETPDWMQSFGQEEGEKPEAVEQAPEWLSDLSAVSDVVETENQAVEGLEAEAIEGDTTLEGEPALGGEIGLPDWLEAEDSAGAMEVSTNQPEVMPSAAVESAEMPDLSDMDATMAWLEGLAAKQGADEATLVTPPEQRLEEPPDWVKKQTGELSLPVSEEESPAAEVEPLAEDLGESIELPELAFPELELRTEEATVDAEAVEAEAIQMEELPDWLQAIEEPETAQTGEVTTLAAETEAEGVPDATMPDLSDMDATMAWLEGLAAKQGADEATLVTTPEERLEEPPDWVLKQTGGLVLPDVEGFEAEDTASQEPSAEVEPTAELAPTLLETDEEQTILEELVAPDGLTVEGDAQPGELPDWLKGMEALEPTEPIEISTTPVESEDLAPAEAEAGMPDFSDMDATMAWLEGLAAKQGADEATLITPPDQRTETPPEWVVEVPAAEEPAEQEPPVEELAVDQPVSEDTWQPEATILESPTAEATLIPEEVETEEPVALSPEVLETTGEETFVREETSIDQPAAEPDEPLAPESAPGELAQESSVMDNDDAFAWLESLAAKHGAEEGSLINAPEDRLDAPPDWVVNQTGQVESLEDVLPEQEVEVETTLPVSIDAAEERPAATEAAAEITETPDWLESIQAEETSAVSEGDTWMQGFEEKQQSEEPAAETTIPEWLSDVGEEAPVQAADESGALPGWLQELEESEAGAISTSETVTAPTDFRSAWEPEIEIPQPEQEGNAVPGVEGLGLEELQEALRRGDLDTALEGYNELIENDQNLEETIHDLRDALYRYPVDIAIWQTLGDAYAKNNQLQEALDAYTKAEELLR